MIASYFQTFDSTEPLAHWLAQLPPAATLATASPDARAALAVAAYSALFLREPGHAELASWQQKVQVLPSAAIDPNLRLRATMLLAKQAWYSGAHAALALLPERARAAVDDRRTAPYGRLLWGLALQYRAWAVAAPAAGREATRDALACAQSHGIHGLDRHLHLHDACFAQLQGDAEAAQQALQAAKAGFDASRRMEAWHLFSVEAWLALERGEYALAAEAATLGQQAGAAMGPAPTALTAWIAGQVALAAGHDAQPSIEMLRAAARQGPNPRAALAADWLCAAQGLAGGDEAAVAQPLQRALRAMRSAGGGLWFGLHHALAARLVAWALRNGLEPQMARELALCHRLAPPPQADASWPWPVRVHRGGQLRIEVDGKPVSLSAKQPRRPLELLQLLLLCGGQSPAATLADTLWPESEGDRAMAAFEVALRRLRALLGHPDALLLSGGRLALNRQCVWVQTAAASRQPLPENATAVGDIPKLMDLRGRSVGHRSAPVGDHDGQAQ